MKLCVLGAGAWGTAVATVLAKNGFEVALWCREEQTVECIKKNRVNNEFLPGIDLDKKITPISSLSEALKEAEWVLAAVPVKFFRLVLEQVKPYLSQNVKWVVLNKGIEQKTLLVPTQIIAAVLGEKTETVALVGPSFAKDLAEQQLTAVVAAGNQDQIVELQTYLQNDYFLIDQSEDKIGVQLCAALKNVITLGVGILDGAGYSDNTKALFLVKSLAEIKTLVVACGGKSETVDGFAGIGDLVLTALGKCSRNLALGKKIGEGQSLQTILSESLTVAEGINTTCSVQKLIEQKKLDLPLFTAIFKMIKKGSSIQEFLKTLSV